MLTRNQLKRLRAASVPPGSNRVGLAISLAGVSQATVGEAVGNHPGQRLAVRPLLRLWRRGSVPGPRVDRSRVGPWVRGPRFRSRDRAVRARQCRTLAAVGVNRDQTTGAEAAGRLPPRACWRLPARVVEVRRKYGPTLADPVGDAGPPAAREIERTRVVVLGLVCHELRELLAVFRLAGWDETRPHEPLRVFAVAAEDGVVEAGRLQRRALGPMRPRGAKPAPPPPRAGLG